MSHIGVHIYLSTSEASANRSPGTGLGHPWNGSARFSVNCIVFPLSDCGLLEGRDLGVTTLVSPKPLIWEQMLSQSPRSGRPNHLNHLLPCTPPPFPGRLRALCTVCTEARSTGGG